MKKTSATDRHAARTQRRGKRHATVVKPGGVSWQAMLLNFFTRHAIKRPVERRGLNPRTARTVVRRLEWLTAGFRRFVGVERRTIAGVPCDVIYPRVPNDSGRSILYLHGGGFFLHLPRSYRRFAHRIANRFGATVYLPDYRLAPEHRHPAAPDDCLAVYRALLDDGCNAAQLAIMGDSAGGNLALVTLLRARDDGLPLPACATLLSPGADLTYSGASYRANAHADPLVPMNALHQVTIQYVDAKDKAHPHASPMLGDLSGLPPLSILVGSTEVLLDSSVSTAKSLQAAGGCVTLQIWEYMPHVFPLFHFLPEGKLAMDHMSEFFRRHTDTASA